MFFESINNIYELVYRDKNVEKIFVVYFYVVKKKVCKDMWKWNCILLVVYDRLCFL